MKCPHCGSSNFRKNGKRRGKQNHLCKNCKRQFVDVYSLRHKYPDETKRKCLEMYLNGMGFRAIERVTKVSHVTVANWVEEQGKKLSDVPELETVPEVGEVDELQTFVGSKKDKVWIWTAVNHFKKGILAWVIGDRSAKTFEMLWQIIYWWQCYFWVSDGYKVYPKFINNEDHIVSKTYMTRVEGENTRLRHYLARLHRKTLCYSKSVEMLKHSIRLLLHYLHNGCVALAI